MSTQMQFCGIVTLLILLFFYSRHKRTHLITERVFHLVLWAALVCLSLDAGSIVAINTFFTPDDPNARSLLVDYICKAYLLTLPAMGISTLLYVCANIYGDRPKVLQTQAFYYTLVGLLGMIAIFALPIKYVRNAENVVTNTDGPSVYAAYVMITFYLVAIIYQLARNRSKLNRSWLAAVVMWMALWIGAFITQLADNSLLLAGFACSIGILILYLALENPEANFDKATGLFTSAVLNSYLHQKYSHGEDFAAMLLLFDGSPDRGLGKNSAAGVRQAVGRYAESQPGWMVFKQSEVRLFFVFDTAQEARDAQSKVARYVYERWPDQESLPVRLYWILVPSAQMVDSDASLLYLMRHLSHKHYFQEDLLEVDAKVIEDAYQDLKVEGLLDSAIQNDAIEVFYQPIYSTRLRRITAAEALVRIRDEEGKMVPPGLFIPIAEANGMILALGKLIFEHVCRFIKAHPLEELGLSYIEVNLSVVQCANADLATDYIDIMRRFGISPKHINLEITETASTSTKKALLKNMDQLIDYGTSFSLDDFGTGQSNLDYIIDLPVQIAKFDRVMTQAYFSSQRASQVMNAAIRMIHDMGLSIVSEGVETEAELLAIQALGVEYIQGFFFSKPLSEADFLEYLKNFQPPFGPPEEDEEDEAAS